MQTGESSPVFPRGRDGKGMHHQVTAACVANYKQHHRSLCKLELLLRLLGLCEA